MGLFDKKYCDVCGDKIGLLGNRKLEDGNLCKECAKKLSPWFDERRHSTVDEIKAQLAYREENRDKVRSFHVTRTLGQFCKVLLDEDAKQFMVTASRNYEEENPDVLSFSDVTGCIIDIDESKTELKREDKDGNKVSYVPPRYTYRYTFRVIIHVNNPWFDDITFALGRGSVEGKASHEYRELSEMGEEIKSVLTQTREAVREGIAADAAPKVAAICPACGATTIPDANGCCEYCGSAMNA